MRITRSPSQTEQACHLHPFSNFLDRLGITDPLAALSAASLPSGGCFSGSQQKGATRPGSGGRDVLAEQLTALAVSAAQLFLLLASGLYCALSGGGDGLALIVEGCEDLNSFWKSKFWHSCRWLCTWRVEMGPLSYHSSLEYGMK